MEGGLAVMRAIGHQHLPQAGHGSAVKQRQEGPVGQHQLGAAMGNDIAHLAGRQAPVHWHVYGAQLGGGQRQQQGLDMELGQHCHAVAGSDAGIRQRIGDAVAVALDIGKGPLPIPAAIGQRLRDLEWGGQTSSVKMPP